MEPVFLIGRRLPHILKPTLHPAVACRTPKTQNWQSAAPKRRFAIQAIPMILARFRRNSQARTIHALYGAIVAQARSVTFYADYRVPDTVEGRIDLLVLHLVLLLNRPGRNAEAWRKFVQNVLGEELFDAFCGDLDANLREMGVGDL